MKHKENNCQVPFCGECWKNLKSNIEGIMKVATDLSNPTDEENMKLDAKKIPLPGYFTSNPTNSMRDATQELFNVCRCGLVPFRHVVSFHDWEGAESVEVFKSPDSLVEAPTEPITPDRLRELDNPMAAAHLEVLERASDPDTESTDMRMDDPAIASPVSTPELELEEFIRDVTQAIPKPKSEVRRKIKTLIHKAAITELEYLKRKYVMMDFSFIFDDRIKELKADNE